jgi:AP-1 complex subunit gamma-1
MPPVSQTTVVNAFDKNGLKIVMELSKPSPAQPASTKVTCKFSNATAVPMSSLVFQAAVPKYLKLEMMPPSSTTIPAGSSGAVTQEIRVTNSMQGEKNLMFKLKIGYAANGSTVWLVYT